MDLIENLTLICPIHGADQPWEGDAFCKGCNQIYLCAGIETENECPCGSTEFLTMDPSVCAKCGREPKKKFIYPDAPPKGMCTCGKRLFGGTDFTARPMCHLCAVRVTTRKAAEKGEILWKGLFEGEDYADPFGNLSYELFIRYSGRKWHWEVSFPEGDCKGVVDTEEDAREWARKIFLAVVKP